MVSIPLIVLILEATGVTFLRLWILMFVSVVIAIVAGVLAARVRIAELIIIPVTDVLEAVPVISFFPIVLVFFIVDIGGPLGTELAVDFLIITALLWNLILGVYQAVTHIPSELIDLTYVYKFSTLRRIAKLYVPASVPKIVANVMPSFASGLFYITLSEMISVGNHNYHVFGVGEVAVQLAGTSNLLGTLLLIVILVAAIVLTFFFIINPLVRYAERFNFEMERTPDSFSASRKRSALINSLSQRTSQVTASFSQILYSISRVSTIPVRGIRRKVKLSERNVNYVVGAVLILVLAVSIYIIAQSGFSEAFLLYVINRRFLLDATVGAIYDLTRIVIVYAISLATMVPLAIIAGRRWRGGNTLNGIMQVVYSIPAPVFYPLILIYLTPFIAKSVGLDLAINGDVLIITYLSAASYIFFNVFGAARSIPGEFNMVASTFKLKRMQRLRYIVFPSIIPALITGSMSAVGSYWAGLMIGEYEVLPNATYSVSFGLMKMIDQAIASGNLLYADAIDIYMVIIIIIMSYLIWIRLYDYSRKKYTLE